MDFFEVTKAPFVTPPNIVLPPWDVNGQLHGEGYKAAKKARTQRLSSTRATHRGMKFKRRFESLAQTEFYPLIALAFNPYVVDIREQYPILKPGAFERAVAAGRRLYKTDQMTIDIVVTMLLPPEGRLHYHGISVKSAQQESFSDKEQRRLEREQVALEKLGWTWQLMLSNPYQPHELSNCLVMFRTVRDQDVVGQYDQAKVFAWYLLTRSTEGRMTSVMSRVAKQLGISDDRAHQLFAIAVSFGMLRLDHTRPLRPEHDLPLLR